MRRIFDRFDYDHGNIIGRGGMGTVYHGVDITSQQPVAIKHLAPSVVNSNPFLVERFQREGEALRELNHPNIVKMLDAGKCDSDHFIVMEYVSGGSLRDLLDKQTKIIVQRALYVALDLADALTRAHRLKILHRDIKPANILLATDGTPRLTDFGVARTGASNLTDEGSLVGTLAYLSPESLLGEPIDERHDIWAFGVVLYELLTGERPYPDEAVAALIAAITTQPLPDLEALRPDIPIALVDLIYRMLEKDPNARIRSVRMVGAELEAIIQGADQPALLTNNGDARFRTTTEAKRISTSAIMNTSGVHQRGLHNFPVDATPFVGRERELNDLSKLIADPNQRLITIVGPGGVGKTRMAIAAAAANQHLFPDGVYYVPLESVDDASQVPNKIAEAMEMQLAGSESPFEQAKAYLRTKHVMLVMDNLEQLAEGAQLMAENLNQMPNVTVLATSRERLRLRGEQVYEVDSMKIPPPDLFDPVTLLAEYPVMHLFVNSARRNQPDFELNQDNADCVNSIVNLVQGVPLGVELAVGWLEMLPLDEIAGEIEKSLDFLETDIRDIPERHRSLRAVFDHSWNLMTEDERDAFMKLSLFRSGFERAAAQKIMGTSLRTLAALVNKSLLFRRPDGRYAIPKLLRQYAHDRFGEHCTETTRVMHQYAAYYADYLNQFGDVFSIEYVPKRVAALTEEFENIRHAWRIALMQMDLDLLEQMVDALYQYYMATSTFTEGGQALTELTDKLAAAGHQDTNAYWIGRGREAALLGRRGDYIRSEQIGQEVLAYFEAQANAEEVANANNNQAYALMMLGRYDEARTAARSAYEIGDRIGSIVNSAIGRGNLGYIEYLAGNYDEAQTIYKDLTQNDGLYTRDKSPIGYAFGCNNLGEIMQAKGHYDEAEGLYREAYEVFKEIDQRRGMAFTTNNIGGIYQIKAEYEKAKDYYQRAFRLNRENGDRAGVGHSLSAMGNLAIYVEHDYEAAYRYFHDAMELRREIGDRAGYGQSLTEVGMCLYMLGRGAEARPYYEEAIAIGEALNNRVIRGLACIGLGGVELLEAGDPDRALPHFKTAIELVKAEEHQSGVMYVIASMAVILAERGMDEHAARLIGYVEKFADVEKNLFVKPLLENLRYALKNKMGAGYTQAHAAGQHMVMDDIVQIVQGA